MSHSSTAVIRLWLGRVRRAIREATRGIRGLWMATSWGNGTGNSFPIASLLGDRAPTFEGPILGDEICGMGASRCRALSLTPDAICTPIVKGISTIENQVN